VEFEVFFRQTVERLARQNWRRMVAVMALAAQGCSGGNQLPLVPVSGRVTFAGGPCPAAGNVTFVPVEGTPGLPRRPGAAKFETDGEFTVTSFAEGDGLLPGKYRVSITCYSGLPDPTSPDPFGDVSYVPNGFELPELIVQAESEPVELTYNVPPKRK
jgi:hypothetical protein